MCFFGICANSIVPLSRSCLKLSKHFCFRSCQVRTWILFKTHSVSQHNRVSCTYLETKMKTFAALLLVFALATYVSAFERPFHTAVFDFLDERHDEKMAQVMRDQGFSDEDALIARDHPEPPEWMVSEHILSLYSPSSPSRSSFVSRAKARPASFYSHFSIPYHGQFPMSRQNSLMFSLKEASVTRNPL